MPKKLFEGELVSPCTDQIASIDSFENSGWQPFSSLSVMDASKALKPEPEPEPEPEIEIDETHWLQIAARFNFAMMACEDKRLCLAILNQLSIQLGGTGYPGFLKLLILLSKNGEKKAKTVVAEAIVDALQSSEFPSGKLSAWGGSRAVGDSAIGTAVSASHLMRSMWGETPARGLGPIEYLTVWYSQRTQRPYLSNTGYTLALTDILTLFNCSDYAPHVYSEKLLLDVESFAEGAYTRQTRQRLSHLAHYWIDGWSPEKIAKELLDV